MRAADRAEQARIDATLALLDEHLDAANIGPGLARRFHDVAEVTLHLRDPNSPVGWLVAVFDGRAPTHVGDLTQVVWHIARAVGELVYVYDLGAMWRLGAGDAHVLAEVAARMPQSDVTPTGWPQ